MRSRGVGVMSTYAVALSPLYEQDGTILLGAERGLRRSRDRGRTWDTIALEPEGPSVRGWAYEVRSIRYSPGYASDRGVLALSEAGLFLSDDAADTWRRVAVPEERARRLGLAPDWPADPVLFIGGESLRRSDDGGATWSEPLAGGEILAVACASDFATSGEVFALSLQEGFLRSEDRGRTFQVVPEALGGFSPTNLRLSPAFARDGEIWVATLSGGLRVSRDRGRTFAALLPPGSLVDTVNDLALAPDYPADPTVVACAHEGVAISRDAGRTWRLASRAALYDEHRDPWLLRGTGWQSQGLADAFVFGEHRSDRAGDRAVLPFAGRGVTLLGSRGPDHGRLRIHLDGAQVALVDAWAVEFEAAATLFESAELEPAFHSLEVEVAGESRPGASGAWVAVDAAVVRCEPERAGSLPVLARREALMLGPDVSYGRDVRPLASPHAPSATDESVRAKGDVLRPVLLGLAALAALALLLRRRRASRA
jgi:photosystem II stability/assembly factor-like uncharacterized protein